MFWKEEKLIQMLASCIWNTSELLKIPLGRFAPIVFNLIMRQRGNKQKKSL
jgi:hypothetical protein